jgi:hypothetical protein
MRNAAIEDLAFQESPGSPPAKAEVRSTITAIVSNPTSSFGSTQNLHSIDGVVVPRWIG